MWTDRLPRLYSRNLSPGTLSVVSRRPCRIRGEPRHLSSPSPTKPWALTEARVKSREWRQEGGQRSGKGRRKERQEEERRALRIQQTGENHPNLISKPWQEQAEGCLRALSSRASSSPHTNH